MCTRENQSSERLKDLPEVAQFRTMELDSISGISQRRAGAVPNPSVTQVRARG